MTKAGGVLTVLSVRRDGVMLSWAGGATAAVAPACQGGQSMLVTDTDYQQLWAIQTPRAGGK